MKERYGQRIYIKGSRAVENFLQAIAIFFFFIFPFFFCFESVFERVKRCREQIFFRQMN